MIEETMTARPQNSRGGGALILLTVALMYVSLGSILGFIQGGIAPVLRSQGMELTSLRWAYALYVPFGVAFAWSPWIDRWRWPWLGRRTGWIVPMQAVAVGAVVGAATLTPERGAWTALLTLGLLATACSATVDLALDALTVEHIPDSRRTAAAAAKMGGMSIGTVLGGGLLVALYPRIGWSGSMMFIAGVMTISGLLTFMLVSTDRALPGRLEHRRAALKETFRKPGMKVRLVRLTLLACTLVALFNFNRLMLIDMGVPLERIGSVLGTAAPAANAGASLLVAMLVRTVSPRNLAWIVGGLCLAAAGTVLSGYVSGSATSVILGAILTSAGAASMYVVLGSLILQWAEGTQPATDYALLYGLGRLVATISLMALPGLIQAVGWPAFQATLMVAFAISIWYFMRLFPK
ncbi:MULTISPECIES: MFS transporter [unclassified Sinorhizobium]|uniref:MFS transporter n=1 Tax=unclassified Sinorhizobium TaxID=2613772 RepID=UPI003523B563